MTVVTPGFFPTQLIARGAFHVLSRRVRAEEITRAATFTADDVAKAALAASRRGRLHVTLGRRARWMWRWKRMAPLSLMHALSRRYRQSIEGEA